MTYAEEIVKKMIFIGSQHNLLPHEYAPGTPWYSYIRDEAISALDLKTEFEEEIELIDGEIRGLLDVLK
jgi:hypothetical protein